MIENLKFKRFISWFDVDQETQKIPVLEAYYAYKEIATKLQLCDTHSLLTIYREPSYQERMKIILYIQNHLEKVFGKCQYIFEENNERKLFYPMFSKNYNKHGFPFVPKSYEFLEKYLTKE